jgi:poly-beta-1,6-N-acetyl-D-glucosamine synthase
MLVLLIYILAAAYFTIIFSFFIGLFLQSKAKNSVQNTFSIVIAARNEKTYLPNLIEILVNQSYPKDKYEIIIADDRSTDSTPSILEECSSKYDNFKFITITKENPDCVGKKGALTAAIGLACNDILAFTDADCVPTKYWLSEINAQFHENVDFVAGYSFLKHHNKFIEKLKNLERAAIFAVTAGSFGLDKSITCAGGNIAYRRELFKKVNGFSGLGYIRSGDDDLMLQKLSPFLQNKRFIYEPKSFVTTYAEKRIKQQVNQETRRASKFKHYTISIKLMVITVFLFYLAYIGALIATLTNDISLHSFLIVTAIKIVPEFLLLFHFLRKIKKTELMKLFPLAEIIYIPYFVFFGLKGTLGNYKWKE